MKNTNQTFFSKKKRQPKENIPIRTVKSKNPQHKADNLNKELNNVEYLLKVEEKNKKNIQQKYEKEINQIDLQKSILDEELDQALKEINEKEAQIFQIQKNHYDQFREEIEKYQLIIDELKSKEKDLNQEVVQAESKQNQYINISDLLKEEDDSYKKELLLLKTIVKEKIIELRELESSYPKEFKCLQEDFQLAKELSELKLKNNIINIQLKQIKTKNNSKTTELKTIENQRNIILEEYSIIGKEITETGNDPSLTKLKEHIIKNIKNIYLWDTILFIIRQFFSEKIFDVDNKFHERLHQQLILSLSAITKDFTSVIAKKEKERNVIIKRINEIRPNTQEEKKNYLIDMTTLQKELEAMTTQINALKEKYSRLDQLYNSILLIIQSKGYNCSDDLEIQFKKEILSMILHDNKFSIEEIGNFEHLIQTFFNEIGIKERLLKSLRTKRNKIQNQLNQLNSQIEEIKSNITELNESINKLSQDHKNNSNNINLISETIIVRNKNLKANLENLSEEQFRNYLKQNENAFKNMKKIYGNKILNKVYKKQKEKFMENVLIDHNEKKIKVNEDISFIAQYDRKFNEYKKGMNKIEVEYHYSLEYINQLNKGLEGKKKEKQIIIDSIEELEQKIKTILEDQVRETAQEKDKLKYKYNINFYLNKIKDLKSKIDKYEKQKTQIQCRYQTFQKEYDEKTHKLHFEDLNIKNNYIAVVMGVDEELASTGHPFRHQDTDPNSPMSKQFSSDSVNIDETVHKSLEDFNNIDSKLTPDALRSNALEKLDYQQFVLNPEVNILKEKLRPLHNGLMIYKRFNYTTGFSKYNIFDPKKADKMPPENCGYVMRTFKLNQQNMSLDVYAPSDFKRAEIKIVLRDIRKININPISKELIKAKEKISTDLAQQLVLFSKNDYIQFTLALKSSIVDLISPSYLTFTSFQTAINDLINMKPSVLENNIKQIHFDADEENPHDELILI